MKPYGRLKEGDIVYKLKFDEKKYWTHFTIAYQKC